MVDTSKKAAFLNKWKLNMATPARELGRYRLPARIRAKKAPAGGISFRLALADRIADLPNIQIVDDCHDDLPCSARIYLESPPFSLRKRPPPVLLGIIGCHEIEIHGITDWDKHQVLSAGWGKVGRDQVAIYLPRDDGELDICWGIFCRAYQSLFEALAKFPRVNGGTQWDPPRFSRTTLQ